MTPLSREDVADIYRARRFLELGGIEAASTASTQQRSALSAAVADLPALTRRAVAAATALGLPTSSREGDENAPMEDANHSLVVTTENERGTLARITAVIAGHPANITRIESLGVRGDGFTVYLELELQEGFEVLLDSLRRVPVVRRVEEHPPLAAIYGKQVVIMGGGAQVGQVALGAVGEADRHNIRGERISVDTIPLVGEEPLAEAVAAVARLPRARVLVLAGALMGGAITDAVREVQRAGVVVISLSMAGGMPRAADLVVSDPVLAGVMAVMAVADTASFDIERQRGRSY